MVHSKEKTYIYFDFKEENKRKSIYQNEGKHLSYTTLWTEKEHWGNVG